MASKRDIRSLANWATLYLAISLLVAALVGCRYGSYLAQSDATLAGILSVFSILAGVLVAVISIIGDPSMLLTGNWRLGYEHAQTTQIRIANYANLIFVYVVILITVLAATIVKDNKIEGADWLFSILLGLVTFALLMSLPLPYSLMGIQKERMAEEIKRRKSTPPAS